MKNLLVAFAVSLFLFNGLFAQEVDSDAKKNNDVSPVVISIHNLELKADVNAKEFETFVLKELAPIYNKMKGQKFFLVKGDRGIRTDKYAIVLTFESIEDRDRIYPPSGEFVGDFGDDSIWEKFDTFIVEGLGKNHTDYVRVNQ